MSPAASPAPAAAAQTIFPAVHVELDVTPRWFEPTLAFLPEDGTAIFATFGAYEGTARRLFVDLSVGVSGVRLVLVTPAGNPTNGLEAERLGIKAQLDALDTVHPRRARVTAQRRAAEAEEAARAEAKRAEAEEAAKAAAATPPPQLPLPPPQVRAQARSRPRRRSR